MKAIIYDHSRKHEGSSPQSYGHIWSRPLSQCFSCMRY